MDGLIAFWSYALAATVIRRAGVAIGRRRALAGQRLLLAPSP